MSLTPISSLGSSGLTSAQAQAACAAAITAASLATASSLSTLSTTVGGLVTDVGALPSAADVATEVGAQAACAAAIAEAADISPAGTIAALIYPANVGPFLAEGLTGSTSYEIVAGGLGSSVLLYGYMVTSDKVVTVRWQSFGGQAITAFHRIAAGVPLIVGPFVRRLGTTEPDEGLWLAVSDATASVNVTYWGETV